MGKGSIERKRKRNAQLRTQQLEKNKSDGVHTYRSLGITAKDAFKSVIMRVNWLNDKIAWNQANGLKFMFYVHERESLLWMVDKVKELSEKLLSKE